MRPGERPAAGVAGDATSGPVPTDDDLTDAHVICYVRSSVPGPVVPTVDAIVGRVERLAEADRIGSVRVTHWPPERHAVLGGDGTTREELVEALECWAAECGCSLEPAFSRRERPTSPYGASSEVGTDGGTRGGTLERVRVPLVALGIYDERVDADTDVSALEQHRSDAVQGVVPYTEPREQGDDRTCTVDDWITAIEPSSRRTAAGGTGNGSTPLETWQ